MALETWHMERLYVLWRGVSDVCCHHSLPGTIPSVQLADPANVSSALSAVAPTIRRLRPVEQSRAFAFPPSHLDVKVPRAAQPSSARALDRQFECAASS